MGQILFVVKPLFIGSTELLLIGGIALLLFGGKKLPEMMRGLGQGVREFKKSVNEAKDEVGTKDGDVEDKSEMSSYGNNDEQIKGHSKSDLKNDD